MNHAFDVDGLDREVVLEHVAGIEGPSLYVNGVRVAGPKPWGGGTCVQTWRTSVRDLLEGIVGPGAARPPTDDDLRALAGSDPYEFHAEYRRRQTPLLLAAVSALAERAP